MRRVLVAFLALSVADVAAATQAPAIKLDKAALAAEVTNDQGLVIVPPAGQRFLWVTATAAGAPVTFDLTKVTVSFSQAALPLVGVDSAWGGDPKQFSMIARAARKTGGMLDPLEETRSVGTIGFAFTPGKTAALKVIAPPQSFCLLFVVPDSFKTGQVQGLGAKPLALPVLTAR